MGYFEEAYDAAVVRALVEAVEKAKRRMLGRVRIFIDAQAAITRMTHDEPGPCQAYALQVRKAIAALREREPCVEIEIRWCPAHKGIPGMRSRTDGPSRSPVNRTTTGSSGSHTNRYGRRFLWPASLAYPRNRVSEKKWPAR